MPGRRDRQKLGQPFDDPHDGGLHQQYNVHAHLLQIGADYPPGVLAQRAAGLPSTGRPLSAQKRPATHATPVHFTARWLHFVARHWLASGGSRHSPPHRTRQEPPPCKSPPRHRHPPRRCTGRRGPRPDCPVGSPGHHAAPPPAPCGRVCLGHRDGGHRRVRHLHHRRRRPRWAVLARSTCSFR